MKWVEVSQWKSLFQMDLTELPLLFWWLWLFPSLPVSPGAPRGAGQSVAGPARQREDPPGAALGTG